MRDWPTKLLDMPFMKYDFIDCRRYRLLSGLADKYVVDLSSYCTVACLHFPGIVIYIPIHSVFIKIVSSDCQDVLEYSYVIILTRIIVIRTLSHCLALSVPCIVTQLYNLYLVRASLMEINDLIINNCMFGLRLINLHRNYDQFLFKAVLPTYKPTTWLASYST